MGFLDNLKEAGKSVVKGISKTIKKAQVESRGTEEAYQIKRGILTKLSISELKNLAYLLNLKLGYETYMVEGSLQMKERKVKLNKFDYVDAIAKTSYSELALKLRHMHKSSLADEMERDVGLVVKRMDEEKEVISNEVKKDDEKKSKDLVLSVYLKTIMDEIISLNPEKSKNEREYQIELKAYLKGAIPKELQKQKVFVDTEYRTKTGRRIDIMVQIDNYKIGIETKLSLSSSGQFQRVKGQVLEYAEFVDALILVQKEPLEDQIGMENLKQVAKLMPKPFMVVANGNVKIS